MNDIFVPYRLVDFDPFTGPEIYRVLPLTESQIEIWLACVVGGDQANSAYNESNSMHFKGELNVSAFQKAVATLTDRHESLRSSFSGDGKSMVIYKKIPNQFLYKDLALFSDQDKSELLHEHLREDAMQIFNLLEGPLFKATLLKFNEKEYRFTFTAHHLIIDGWSIGVVMQELGKLYSSYIKGITPEIPSPKAFSEYAQEQKNFVNSQPYREIENYWLNQFKGNIPVVSLPTDYPRPHTKTYKSGRLDLELNRSLVASLRKVGIDEGTSFVNTLLTAFEVFLYRLTGQKDITIGMPASGQAIMGYSHLVGHCVNLLPIRSQPNGKLDFATYLSLRKSDLFDAYENQQLTFGSLLKKLKVSRDPSRIPLVPVVFNVDFGMDEGVDFHHLEFEMISNPKAFLNFEWFLNANGTKESVKLEWTYNSQLFNSETMQRMMHGFVSLLKSIVSNPLQNIDTIKIFDEKVNPSSLWKSTNLSPDFSKFQPVHSLIEHAALKFGIKTAVFFRDEKCSYEELNNRANQLAHYLIQSGLKPGETVGIVLDRSTELIVAILATLKAGGAYLPIDTDYPSARVEYMLQDSAKLHITQKEYQNKFTVGSHEILFEEFDDIKNHYSTNNPHVSVKPNDAAYIIYTSGSTGQPKGVVLEHHSLFNFLVTVSEKPGITHEDKFLAVSSISFDIAILEVLLPYVHGAQSFLLDRFQRKDPGRIVDLIEDEQITIMFATPSHWKMMLDGGWQTPCPNFNMISGGEALSAELADKLLPLSKSLWNIYGPTETTVFSTIKKINKQGEKITIGKPVLNTQIYILDDKLHPVGEGKEGEIFIAGRGVARGYLNRPDLTAEKFLKDPFKPSADTTMYRTGDLGKFSPNGEIIILGRKDHQVKIRGHRIEPGEIEHALTQLEDIHDAVVSVREDSSGNPRLVAYLIPSEDNLRFKNPKDSANQAIQGNQGTVEEIKEWKRELALYLPSFMIPADYVVMDHFPLTPSGKIDMQALPIPSHQPVDNSVELILAETPEEKLIAAIWEDALGFAQVNITDNFFEIGGHSMIAVQVMTRLEKASNIKLPISILFEFPTVQQLARILNSSEKNKSWNSLVPIKPNGNKIPLYIVHGGGLNVLPFYSIAKHLDSEQPLYGIQAFGLNGLDKPFTTVESIASHYVGEILSQNPTGPYALAGYSFGGIIAFEMAKQLQKKGKVIKSLIMFDTYADRSERRDAIGVKIVNRLRTELGRRIFDLEMLINNPALLKRVKKNALSEKLKKIKKHFFKRQSVPESDIMKIIKSIRKIHEEAGKKYVLSPYDGEIHLLRAKLQINYLKDPKYFGWQPYVNKVNISEMDGEHTTMFDPPHEKDFVKILQDILNKS